MTEGGDGVVPGWNELLSDVSGVSRFQDFFQNGWIIDLLRVIEFPSPWISCGVVVSDVFVLLPYAADHVTVHYRYMVDVELQFKVFRSNTLYQVDTKIHVVPEVA